MLTLLKQARAYGLGCVLATQNPVDLDYKGLSNAGTWFLGRLQTERDKARVLEGLEGASAQAGSTFDRGEMEATLAALGNRVFLMNNVHDDEPVVFQTRWAMSYLRGPLTRDQIKVLMDPIRGRNLRRRRTGQGRAAAATTAKAAQPLGRSCRPAFAKRSCRSSTVCPTASRSSTGPACWAAARCISRGPPVGIDVWRECHLLQTALAASPEDIWENAIEFVATARSENSPDDLGDIRRIA